MSDVAVPPPLAAACDRVLGTPVFPLQVPPRREITIVSDLHLHPDEPAPSAAFEALLSRVPDGELALVLGDLFEFWVGRSQLGRAEWRRVPGALAAAARRGVRLYVLHGNRDFQLDRAFERATGARVVPGGLLLRAEGERPLLCLHGDELCQNDRKYQRSKRWLRSRFVRAALHAMPWWLARRLAGRARKVSRDTVAKADPESLRPSRRALAEVRALGDADLMFGHIHEAACDALPGDGTARSFFVLPAFEADERGHAVWTPGSAPRFVVREVERDWPPKCRLGP